MPSLFISHGAPTYALDPGLAGRQLSELGRQLGQPSAIVVVSPHWMTQGVEISATERPETVHDFGGFPRALYALQYPAPGTPELAVRIQHRLREQGIPARLDPHRGLDHGAWVPLLHLYPSADVPTLQVSLPLDSPEQSVYALGEALSPLAQEGVLLIGSGSLTHNLQEVQMHQSPDHAASYAAEFSSWVRQAVLEGDISRLLQTLSIAPHAARAHPTTEHFLPLLFAVGAAPRYRQATVLEGGILHGVLSMESYVFAQAFTMQ